jgi:hypothetical protein
MRYVVPLISSIIACCATDLHSVISLVSLTGDFQWFTEGLMPLDTAVGLLLDTLTAQGWKEWFGVSSKRPLLARILLEATAYGLCNLPVSRSTVLAGSVTLQQLEADGVIELRQSGGSAVGWVSCRSVSGGLLGSGG